MERRKWGGGSLKIRELKPLERERSRHGVFVKILSTPLASPLAITRITTIIKQVLLIAEETDTARG